MVSSRLSRKSVVAGYTGRTVRRDPIAESGGCADEDAFTICLALVVVIPLILPIAAAYDIHPIHLGIIFLANLEIGYSTPPVGLNLFIASARFERPLIELYRASLPFLAILLACLLIITYVPALSLFAID